MERVVFSNLLHHRVTSAVVNHDTITFHTQGDIQ